jgi:hypothetical protein
MLHFVDRKLKADVMQHERILMGYYDPATNTTVPGLLKTTQETNLMLRSFIHKLNRVGLWVGRFVALAVLGGILDRLGLLSPTVRSFLFHFGS